MKTLSATVRDSGEGEQRWFSGGGKHTWLATSEETGGAFLLFEFVGEQGKVTPVHIHPASDETFYVLDGDILLDLAGERRELSTGGVVVIPRGVPHAFMVTSRTSFAVLGGDAGGDGRLEVAELRGQDPRLLVRVVDDLGATRAAGRRCSTTWARRTPGRCPGWRSTPPRRRRSRP